MEFYLVCCCPNSCSMYISTTNGKSWSLCGHNIYMSYADYNIYTYKHTHNYIHVCISTPTVVHVPTLCTQQTLQKARTNCSVFTGNKPSLPAPCQVHWVRAKSIGITISPHTHIQCLHQAYSPHKKTARNPNFDQSNCSARTVVQSLGVGILPCRCWLYETAVSVVVL